MPVSRMASSETTQLMTSALSAIRGRRALLIGDLILDAYVYGETVRVSREAPVLVVRKEREEQRLGGAANTAANLAALGVDTDCLGLVGPDEGGRELVRRLGQLGVRTDAIRADAQATCVKTRVLAGAFGTAKQQVLRIDAEPVQSPSLAVIDALARGIEERARLADVVVLSDYGLGLVSEQLVAAVVAAARAGKPVLVDSRYHLHALAGVTAITPNIPEAEALVGFPLAEQAAVERAGPLILAKVGCEAALITQGRHGMTLFRRGVPSLHVDIVGEDEVTDVTGAGDTVMATFAGAVAAGLGMANGMRLANVAAGIVVTKMGTATATPAELAHAATRHGVQLEPWQR